MEEKKNSDDSNIKIKYEKKANIMLVSVLIYTIIVSALLYASTPYIVFVCVCSLHYSLHPEF